jgi:FkbM family methyltransferase
LKTFLEIGVADFETLIPLARKGGWNGYCVEPMPHHVKTLTEMSAGLPVAICECAISDRTGQIRMAVGGGEKWATGANHVIDDNHLGGRLLDRPINQKRRVAEIEVECFTLDDFIESKGITEIDFCKIDVEGHELNVLKDYSWKVKPKVMKIEHKHTPGNEIDKIILPVGYTLFVERQDVYAIL